MEPQLETAGQELAQSVLLPWEQAFYPGALETVFALRQRQKMKNGHFIRSHHRITFYTCMYLRPCHDSNLPYRHDCCTKLSPLVPALTTPTVWLDVYPVSELVTCCFPLARETCVGGAVGRLKILVVWLSC